MQLIDNSFFPHNCLPFSTGRVKWVSSMYYLKVVNCGECQRSESAGIWRHSPNGVLCIGVLLVRKITRLCGHPFVAPGMPVSMHHSTLKAQVFPICCTNKILQCVFLIDFSSIPPNRQILTRSKYSPTASSLRQHHGLCFAPVITDEELLMLGLACLWDTPIHYCRIVLNLHCKSGWLIQLIL